MLPKYMIYFPSLRVKYPQLTVEIQPVGNKYERVCGPGRLVAQGEFRVLRGTSDDGPIVRLSEQEEKDRPEAQAEMIETVIMASLGMLTLTPKGKRQFRELALTMITGKHEPRSPR